MTNKVKPFYIRITDDITPQMVQDAFDKCVDAGAIAHEGMAMTKRKYSYEHYYQHTFNYFGVPFCDGTFLTDRCDNYGIDAQEINLDQLDEWLGLEQEWKNGYRCTYRGSGAVVIGWHPNQNVVVIDSDDFGLDSCSPCELSKPETPEQKAEREKKEAIDEITDFLNSLSPHCKEKMEYVARAIVDKTNYRKQ